MRVNCDTAQEYYIQQTIKDKLQGYSFTHPKCTGSVLVELALELKSIKEEFLATGGNRHIMIYSQICCCYDCEINDFMCQFSWILWNYMKGIFKFLDLIDSKLHTCYQNSININL